MTTPNFGNGGLVPSGPFGPIASDAARRASDAINLALMADREGNTGRWMAIRLSDGGSDGITYPDVATAARFQLHYKQCMYICIPPGGMPAREAEIMLAYHRRVYDAGNVPPYLEGYIPYVPNSADLR